MEGTGIPASLPAPLAGGGGPAARDISPGHASIHAHVSPMGGGLGPTGNRSGAMARQNSPNKNRAGPLPGQNSPCSPKMAQFCAFCPRMASFLPLSPPTSHAWRTFSRTHPPPDHAGRTISRTGHSHVATMQPMTPLRPLMQASMKPPSPLHAPEQQPLKPASPVRPKNAPKTPISRPQRRWRFHSRTGTSEQRRRRFQTSGPPGLQGPDAIPVAGGSTNRGNCTTRGFDTPATRRQRASCSAKPPPPQG